MTKEALKNFVINYNYPFLIYCLLIKSNSIIVEKDHGTETLERLHKISNPVKEKKNP